MTAAHYGQGSAAFDEADGSMRTTALTLGPSRPLYLKFLLTTRSYRIVVTFCAGAAMLALSNLPAAHLHAEDFGSSFVHRHVTDDGTTEHPASALDHADHSSVKMLDPTFNSQRQYDVGHPLTSVGLVVVAPDQRFAGPTDRIDAPRAHGPPIRIRSLRAPPA